MKQFFLALILFAIPVISWADAPEDPYVPEFAGQNISLSESKPLPQSDTSIWEDFFEPEYTKKAFVNLLPPWYIAKISSTIIAGILAILLFILTYQSNRKIAIGLLCLIWILLDFRADYDLLKNVQHARNPDMFTDKSDDIYVQQDLYPFIEASKKYIDGDVNFYAPHLMSYDTNYSYHLFPFKIKPFGKEYPYYAIFHLPTKLENGELFVNGQKVANRIQLIKNVGYQSSIFKQIR